MKWGIIAHKALTFVQKRVTDDAEAHEEVNIELQRQGADYLIHPRHSGSARNVLNKKNGI
jgi:hypothetical protein